VSPQVVQDRWPSGTEGNWKGVVVQFKGFARCQPAPCLKNLTYYETLQRGSELLERPKQWQTDCSLQIGMWEICVGQGNGEKLQEIYQIMS
jgi:hypothetical protein